MAHSNQIREFRMSGRGIELVEAYLGPSGVLTGAARLAQEAREKAQALEHRQEVARRRRELERKRQALEAQVAALRAEVEAQEEELLTLGRQEADRREVFSYDRSEMARLRHAEPDKNGKQGEFDVTQSQHDGRKKKIKTGRSR
jgi:circadian clock protein KaiC